MKNRKERCVIVEEPDNKVEIDFISAHANVTITIENGCMNINARLFPSEESYTWVEKDVSWELPKPDKD